ncbi:MAG: DNA repair protein RadC [Muribaculaceae bacterium]|nr:DNA repair protein RadC [Muribaculaceae bacterium]
MTNDFSPSEPAEIRHMQPTRTVKEMDPDQQPREKAEKFGCGILSVPELWALILRVGTPGMPITELCRNLMHDNGNSLHKLERRTRAELRKIKGIGTTKSIQVEAVIELIKRYCTEEIPVNEPIRSSADIFERMRNSIGNLDHEEVWILLLNRRNQIIKDYRLTSGSSTASIFDLKKALKFAITENAEGIVMVHNHPSGGTVPSPQDDKITRDLKNGCDFLGLRMLDHVIVTNNAYYSYNDNAKL